MQQSRAVEPGHSPITGRCCRKARERIADEMAWQGLTYGDIARRSGRDESSARQFFQSLGTRKHNIRALAQWSRALSKPPNWLLEVLREHGLR